MRILALSSTYPKSKNLDGAPPFMHHIYKNIAIKGNKIRVLAPHAHGIKTKELIDDIEIFRFRYFFPTRLQKLCYSIMPNIQRNPLLFIQLPFLLASEFYALNKHIKEFKPDMIHICWIIPQGFVSAVASYFYNTPMYLTTHGGDMFPFKKNLLFLKKIYKWIISRHVKISAVNPIFVNELNELGFNNKTSFIPNGVDPLIFNRKNINKEYISHLKRKCFIDKNSQIVLFVGRLSEKKGVSYALRAVWKISETHKNIRFLIVGDGEQREKLEDEAKKLKLKNVYFLGWVPNNKLPSIYSISDIFVAPSLTTKSGDREGFPSTILEAMVMKVPVATTNIDGIDKIFSNRVNIMISKQKSVKRLSRNIIELLNNSKLRDTIIKTAYKDALKKYSWDNVARQYIEFFQK